MKKLFLFITLLTVLASCGSSYSGNRQPKSQATVKASDAGYRDVPFRAHYTWISNVTYDRLISDNIEIIYADSAFRAGDTILVGNKDYILTERVK